jgi:hypothetical protein
MWDVLVRAPRGSHNPRKFSMLLATFFVACFGYIFATAPQAYAADASWDGDNLLYESNTYQPVQSDASFPSDIKQSPAIYQYVDTASDPDLVYFIYFSNSTTDPKSEKEATYIRYTLNPPNRLINPTGEVTVVITPASVTPPNDDDATLGNECTIEGIGWIVCPLMNGIAEGMDLVYRSIRSFLTVQPITTSVDNPIYRIWMTSRDLANIAFVIGFMVIIYSYLVGGGFNGYEIRKILPRLVVAAILINASYLICAVAVDISNIAGYSVNQLFESVRDEVLPGSSTSAGVNWGSVTAWILAGGTGAAAAALTLPAVVGGAAGGLWFILAPFLLGGALLVLVTFIILAARQAIIVVAIATAPLAFAAYILPNTEKWFERWRSLFVTMLVMFPAFGAVFGAAQLAGELIIRTATTIEQVILGLGVMVAPLAVTPLLLKLGGGVLNRFGGMVNNNRKGMYDRYKNYNKERLADHVAKNNARNAEMRRNGTFRRHRVPFTRNTTVPGNLMRRSAARSYAMQNYRENQRKSDEERAQNEWHEQSGRWGYNNHGERDTVRNRFTGRRMDGYGNLDTYKRDNQLAHNQTEAHHEEHWQQLLNTDPTRRAVLTDTRLAEGRGKVLSGAMEAQDDRTFQTALNTDAAYTGLRNMKVQASVDAGVADIHKAAIESAGKLALSTTVLGDRDLRTTKVQTYETEKRSETIDNTLKKNAEAHWDYISRTDAGVQELRLREVQAGDQARRVQEQWNSMVENVAAKGSAAPNLAASSASIANSIKSLRQDIQLESYVQESAKREAQGEMSGLLKSDARLRTYAGGVAGDAGANRIYAKAKSDVVHAYLDDVKNSRSLLSEYTANELIRLSQQGIDRSGKNQVKNDALRDAAQQEILLTKGNNWAFQKEKDYVAATYGMDYDENSTLTDASGNIVRYFKVRHDANGNALRDPSGNFIRDAILDANGNIDQDKIDRNRDVQQMFIDGAKNSKLKIANLSGTDRSNLETGTFVVSNKQAIIRDAKDGKIKPDRWANMDYDEMMRTVQLLRENGPEGMREQIGNEKLDAMRSNIETTLTDPRLSIHLEDRQIEVLRAIQGYAGAGTVTLSNAEKLAIEGTNSKIPRDYDYTTPYDYNDPKGPV